MAEHDIEDGMMCPQIAGDYGAHGILSTRGSKISLVVTSNNANVDDKIIEGNLTPFCRGKMEVVGRSTDISFQYVASTCSIYWDADDIPPAQRAFLFADNTSDLWEVFRFLNKSRAGLTYQRTVQLSTYP